MEVCYFLFSSGTYSVMWLTAEADVCSSGRVRDEPKTNGPRLNTCSVTECCSWCYWAKQVGNILSESIIPCVCVDKRSTREKSICYQCKFIVYYFSVFSICVFIYGGGFLTRDGREFFGNSSSIHCCLGT
jgi:hypothetical protein